MPRWLRNALVVSSFVLFFATGLVFGFLLFPSLRLFFWGKERHRTACTRLLHRVIPLFLWWMKIAGLVEYRRIGLPEDLPRDRAYVLVANHPTIIDTLFLLAWFDDLTCVVKSKWYRSVLLGWLMRSTQYVAGPGLAGDEDLETPALDRMVEQLRRGWPLLVFPEGTRAPPDRLLRFRRGAFEAAVRAGVPVVPIFIAVDHPGLTKGIPLQTGKMRFTIEQLPWVDPAAEDVDAQELCRRYGELYAERYARFLSERDQGTVRAA